MNPNNEENIKKWKDWFEVISQDITGLLVHKKIFWEIQEMIKNTQHDGTFNSFLARCYIAYALMGVRRQIKKDSDSISLKRLLCEMEKAPQAYSRSVFRKLYSDDGEADYDYNKYAKSNEDKLDVDIIKKEIELIENLSKKCENYADTRIAHFDKKNPKNIPVHNELNECIEYLGQLIQKYSILFKEAEIINDDILKTYLGDWKSMFSSPLLKE